MKWTPCVAALSLMGDLGRRGPPQPSAAEGNMTISSELKSDIEAYASRALHHQLFRLARRGAITPAAMAVYVANLRLLVLATEKNLRLVEGRATQLGRPD